MCSVKKISEARFNYTLSKFRKERKMGDRSVVGQFMFIRIRLFKKRMYRTRFELIRENPRGKRKINDSYGGKKSTSTLFSRVVGIARIKISVSIRRFTDKFRHISKGCCMDDRRQNEEDCESMLYEEKQSRRSRVGI